MLRINQVKILITLDNEAYRLEKIAKLLNTSKSNIQDIQIKKKSIDARNKKQILFVYTFDVKVNNEDKILKKNKNPHISKTPLEKYQLPKKGEQLLKNKIVIVGSGPAGLFAAYLLSKNGYKPLIIERGQKMEDRLKDVDNFWQNNKLNEESNVQFGEGGAGTFSDGKLNTLVKDKRFIGQKVFEIFVECGAPKEIMYEQKPHIGTDVLRTVIINLRNKIKKMGGEFLYNTKLTDLIIENNSLIKIEVNNTTYIDCNNLILAIGHSARDTFKMLYNHHLKMEAKPFAVGVRIIHDQQLINEQEYGEYAKILHPASYKLTYTTKEKRGVYTFCMCPGGYVVNASSQKGMLAINGMSNYKRESKKANSAIIVTVSAQDFGNHPLDGIKFQQTLEQKAYTSGKGFIPISTYKDFKLNQTSSKVNLQEIKGAYQEANLNEIFPSYINTALKEAINYFDHKIKGFNNDNTILAAVESRTSSPVRLVRNDSFESNIIGIYPCGEGAGYAGGITTSAIDGIKVAEALITKYYPIEK